MKCELCEKQLTNNKCKSCEEICNINLVKPRRARFARSSYERNGKQNYQFIKISRQQIEVEELEISLMSSKQIRDL